MRDGAIMAQLIATKALPARRDSAWIRRAVDFLARAGRAGDQDAASRGRDLVDELAQLRDRGRAADELGVVAGLQLQLFDFALEPRGFQRAPHDVASAVGLERFFDEVVGALLDRGDRGLDRAVTADDDHGQVRMLALQNIEHLNAVEPASLQPDVEHDEMRAALAIAANVPSESEATRVS